MCVYYYYVLSSFNLSSQFEFPDYISLQLILLITHFSVLLLVATALIRSPLPRRKTSDWCTVKSYTCGRYVYNANCTIVVDI